jgi:hypothetical protein
MTSFPRTRLVAASFLATLLVLGSISGAYADIKSSFARIIGGFKTVVIKDKSGWSQLTGSQLQAFVGNSIAVLDIKQRTHKRPLLFIHYFAPNGTQYRQRFAPSFGDYAKIDLQAVDKKGISFTHGLSEGWEMPYQVQEEILRFPTDNVTRELEIYAKGGQLGCRYRMGDNSWGNFVPCYKIRGNGLLLE